MAASIKKNCCLDKNNGDKKELKCNHCETCVPCPKKALLECGIEGSDIHFTTTGQTINTNHVVVDISGFKKPVVNICYSSQVGVVLQPDDGVTPPGTAEVVLQYDLICKTDSGDIDVGSWTYQRALTVSDTLSAQRLDTTDTFGFCKCLCPNPCQRCIEYFIRITAVKISVNNEII